MFSIFKTQSKKDIEQNEQNEQNITYEALRDKIRELAYFKWEIAGCPPGRDKEFWIEAEKELFGEDPLKDGGYKVKTQENSYVLICPINSELPVDVKLEKIEIN
jgi:hypothetical protein